jgi:hypothetical protein
MSEIAAFFLGFAFTGVVVLLALLVVGGKRHV